MVRPLGTLGRHVARNAIAYLALFFALGGTAYGAAKFTGADIIDNSIFAVDIGENGVDASELAANAVGSSEVANDSLGGADIDESSLEGVVRGSGEVWDFSEDLETDGDTVWRRIGTTNVDLALSCSSGSNGFPALGLGVMDHTGRDLELAIEAPSGFSRATASSYPVGISINPSSLDAYEGFFRF